MRVFFSIHSVTYLRIYESAIREMASRGHEIHLAFERGTDKGWRPALDMLLAEYPTVTSGWRPPPRVALWNELAMTIRRWADLLRYLCPDYDQTPQLRALAAAHVPPGLVWLTNRVNGPVTRRWLRAVLRACERALPPAPEFEQTLRAWRPDVVMVTPLVTRGRRSTRCSAPRTRSGCGQRSASPAGIISQVRR